MTDIDKLAREIVKAQYPEMRDDYNGRRLTIARLAILEGMKLQRERDAEFAENHQWGGIMIAQAIRSAL